MSTRRLYLQLYTRGGEEVRLVVPCTKCGVPKPFVEFGLRRMPNGQVRNVPQCRGCRGAPEPTGPVVEVVTEQRWTRVQKAIAEAKAARGSKP